MKVINSSEAPEAIGPYSQAIQVNGFLYVSGQLPIDKMTGEFNGNNVASQTHQSLTNLNAILNEAGLEFENVVKTTVYLSDMNDFVEMNKVYAECFNSPFPARAAFEVARLPKDALVEIEAVAYKNVEEA